MFFLVDEYYCLIKEFDVEWFYFGFLKYERIEKIFLFGYVIDLGFLNVVVVV